MPEPPILQSKETGIEPLNNQIHITNCGKCNGQQAADLESYRGLHATGWTGMFPQKR